MLKQILLQLIVIKIIMDIVMEQTVNVHMEISLKEDTLDHHLLQDAINLIAQEEKSTFMLDLKDSHAIKKDKKLVPMDKNFQEVLPVLIINLIVKVITINVQITVHKKDIVLMELVNVLLDGLEMIVILFLVVHLIALEKELVIPMEHVLVNKDIADLIVQ